MEDAARTMLLTVSKLLVKYSVNYMIVGGAAMALHGYYRHSINASGELTEKPDIDIWYNPTYENYFMILKVIEELGADVSDFRNEQSPNPRKSLTELKAVAHLDNSNLDQAINYLEAYNLPVGLLLNFGSKKLEFKRTYNTKHPDNAGYVKKQE